HPRLPHRVRRQPQGVAADTGGGTEAAGAVGPPIRTVEPTVRTMEPSVTHHRTVRAYGVLPRRTRARRQDDGVLSRRTRAHRQDDGRTDGDTTRNRRYTPCNRPIRTMEPTVCRAGIQTVQCGGWRPRRPWTIAALGFSLAPRGPMRAPASTQNPLPGHR